MLNNFTKRPLAGLMLACLGLGATAAHADDTMKSDFSDMSTSKYLFGDWGGTRSHLAEEGVTFDLGYGWVVQHGP